LAQTVSSATPLIGANIQFTITLTNLGPLATTSASVTDLLPAGLQFVSAVPTQGSFNSASGVWTVGQVLRNGTAQLVLTAVATTTSTQTNTATITASAPADPNPANNAASAVVTPVQVANLTIVTTISNSTPLVGSNVIFTTTVTNNGPAAATGVQVSDLLPSGFAVVSGLPSAGTYNIGTGVWTIGGLANGATVTLTVTATVLSTGSYTDTASVNATNSLNSGANVISTIAVAPVVPATVSITAPAGGTTYYAPASFTVSVAASITTGQITQVVLYDGSVAVQTQPVNAGSAALNFGLSGIATGTHIYTAVATYGQGYTASSTPVSIIVASAQTANLSVVTKASNLTPAVGSSIVFTTTVTNNGPAAAAAAQVADLLPSGFTFVAAQPGTGSYSAGSGVWTIGALANGATATLTVTATVLATGSYTDSSAVTATNLLSGDSNATSSVTVVPQIPPTVSITAPATGTVYIAPATINLSISASSTSALIAQLALYDGAALLETVPINQPAVAFTTTVNSVGPGTHTYTVVATDSRGVTTTSNAVSVVVLAPTATAKLLFPFNNAFFVAPATITLLASASSTAGAVSQVQFFQNGTAIGTASRAPYSITLTGVTTGTYTFSVKVTDSTSTVTSSNATVTVGTASSLSITSPANGAIIADDVINTLSGTIQAPPNSSLLVNGYPASITSDGRFFANNLALQSGTNSIPVVLTDPSGNVTTQTLTVTSAGSQPFQIGTNILGAYGQTIGIAPMSVEFTVMDPGNTAATGATVSCTNNGNADFSVTSLQTDGSSNSIGVCPYSTPGVYTALISVINASAGTVYTNTVTIVVQDPAALDALLRSSWCGMNNALLAGDQTRALSYLDLPAQSTYAPVFSSLAAQMPNLIAGYSDLTTGFANTSVAEYLLTQNIKGTQQGFFIYFVNVAGIWQLDTM
jgi:large repetitive protein